MDETRWERWAAASGIGFVIALIAGFLAAPTPPKLSDDAATIARYFTDNQGVVLASVVVSIGVGSVLLVWWLGSLRLFLRRAETDGGRLSAVAFGAGLVALVGLLQFSAIRAALAFGLSGTVDASVSKGLFALAYTVDALNVFPVGALLVSASISAWRSGAFPRWLVWLGLVVGLARWVTGLDVILRESILGDEGAIGMLVFVGVMAWIVAASVVMIRRSPTEPMTG